MNPRPQRFPFIIRCVFVLLLLASILTPSRLHAQDATSPDTTISTDRPAVSESSVVVPQGAFQFENGLLVTNAQGASTVDLPETYFRYGLLQKTELRLTVPDYFANLPTGHNSTTSGFSDLALGVKQQLGPLYGFDVSTIFYLSFPTGANSVSSHGYDPAIQVPWTRKLSDNWTLGGQVAFYWPTQVGIHNLTGETAVFLDRQLTKPCDVFLEYAGDFPQRGGSRNQLHLGTAYKLAPHHQLDFHVAVGLSPASPHSYVGFGYSFLFLPK
jgi:Putative MetA-pathway of phenol degradation